MLRIIRVGAFGYPEPEGEGCAIRMQQKSRARFFSLDMARKNGEIGIIVSLL